MSDRLHAPRHSRIRTICVWALRILVALMFLAAGAMKLSGQPQMVAEFEQIGLGQWFRYLTGAIELTAGAAVLVPRYSRWGAIALLMVDAGAFVAQITTLHMDWIHTIVIAAILVALVRLQLEPVQPSPRRI